MTNNQPENRFKTRWYAKNLAKIEKSLVPFLHNQVSVYKPESPEPSLLLKPELPKPSLKLKPELSGPSLLLSMT